MQEVLILIVFLIAIFFIVRKVYLEFNAKDGCAQGCAKCHVSEVTKKPA